jgi:hypothetical protein
MAPLAEGMVVPSGTHKNGIVWYRPGSTAAHMSMKSASASPE